MIYLGNPEQANDFYRLNISVGGGQQRGIVIDTGSTGIVVPMSAIGEHESVSGDYPPPSYSSSGHTYQGQWVKTSAVLTDEHGNKVNTNQIYVFGVTEENMQGVSMMGVGFHSTKYQNSLFNPFVNLVLDGGLRQGYVISSKGVTLGIDDHTLMSFSRLALSSINSLPGNFELPKASVQLSATGTNHSPLQDPTPLLVDTGIDYMILTAGDKRPAYYEETTSQPYHFVAGVKVDLAIALDSARVDQSFVTSDGTSTNTPGSIDPAYVRWGVAPDGTIINTGRHFTYAYDYLFDAERGIVGFRANEAGS